MYIVSLFRMWILNIVVLLRDLGREKSIFICMMGFCFFCNVEWLYMLMCDWIWTHVGWAWGTDVCLCPRVFIIDGRFV